MRSTLEKFWELKDHHGSQSVWSSAPLNKQALEGGLAAFRIMFPRLQPARVVVYQGGVDEARYATEGSGLTLEFHPVQ